MPGGDDPMQMKPDNTIAEYTPPWLKNVGSMTVPQSMPNQLNMLAHNLADGGFGTPFTNLQAMDQIYDPVQVPTFSQTLKKTTTASAPKPSTKPRFGTEVDRMLFESGKADPNYRYLWPDGSRRREPPPATGAR